MVTELFPRIAGVKIENPLTKEDRGLVRCTVRLTRALTSRETERLLVLLGVAADGALVRYTCRPEEVEDREERILRALKGLARPLSGALRHVRAVALAWRPRRYSQ